MSRPRRIAITGANGFLGQHTIKLAIEKGISVNAIVRRETAADLVAKLGAQPFIVQHLNQNELSRAFKGCFGVIHFAGIVREGGDETFEDVNVRGTEAVVNAAKEANLSRLVVPSGLGVDQYRRKIWATNDYFRSKKQVEEIIRKSKISYVIFRPSFILGPGDELIPSLVKQVRRGVVRIVGGGTTPIQPVYVRDASTVFIAAATGEGPEKVTLDLVGPSILNILRLIELIHQTLNNLGVNTTEPQIIHVPIANAMKELKLSREEVSVMLCDKVGDVHQVPQAYNLTLSRPIDAVKAAIEDVLSQEGVE